MSSVMLSSTRKIASAPRARASAMSASTRSMRIGVEVPAAHLDDRAEAAVEGAAARCFDHVDLASEQRIALEHARAAIGQLERLRREVRDHRRSGLWRKPSGVAIRQSGDARQVAMMLERAQQLAQRVLAFAANEAIDRRAHRHRRPAPGWDRSRRPRSGPRAKAPNQPRDLERGRALEGHHRQPHDVGLEFAHQPLDGFRDLRLRRGSRSAIATW